MKRGFYVFLVFVLAVLVSNRLLIDAADEWINNETKFETDTAANKDIYNNKNPETVDDEKNPNELKRKRKKNNEKNNEDLEILERIDSHLLFMICDYLHVDDSSRVHRTSNIIHKKLLDTHASVYEIALRQFMRMVRTPLVHSSLYNTITGRQRSYKFADRNQYQLMKRYRNFVKKNDMLSARMKKHMADILFTTILPPVRTISLNADQPTFRYLYLEKIEDKNRFSFNILDDEIHFAPVPKDNDDGASNLIPHLNDVPMNVLLVFDVWTAMCYLRKPNTKEFISFRYNMPAFFTTENPLGGSRRAEHYIHFWNHKIEKVYKAEDGDYIALVLVHGNGSYLCIGLETTKCFQWTNMLDKKLLSYMIDKGYTWNAISSEIHDSKTQKLNVTIKHIYILGRGRIFFEREYDTIHFPEFKSEE